MKRPGSKRHAAGKMRTGSKAWGLVQVDSTPIRHAARKAYEKARRAVETARGRLEQFREKDQPAHQQWLSREFGQLLTEQRELVRRINELMALRREVEAEIFYSKTTAARAYQNVMARRNDPQPPEPGGGPESEDRFGPDDDEFEGRSPEDEIKERLRRKFHRLFGIDVDDDPVISAVLDNFKLPEPPKPEPRLKDLYRTLARLLHPDRQKHMTPRKLEWWHQTQEAYERGDAEQLEVILTLCEIEDNGSAAKTAVSLLMRVTAEFTRTLRRLNRDLRESKSDPAWNFSARPDRDVLATQIGRELRGDITDLRREIGRLEVLIDKWAKSSRETPAPKSRMAAAKPRWPAGQEEFLF